MTVDPFRAPLSPNYRLDKSWVSRRKRYDVLAAGISPVIRLTTKDAWIWRVIAWALFLVSFGRMKRGRFLYNFATTLGPIQAYPRRWEGIRERTIVHEGGHTLQFLLAGWFVPVLGWLGRRVRVWAGLLPMGVVYGFFPLPMVLAWGRYRLELAADAYSWVWALESGDLTPSEVRKRARAFAELVSSWAYLRAWPRKWAVRGFERRAEKVIAAFEAKSKSA